MFKTARRPSPPDAQDFLAKIEWEGGLGEAFLAYGLNPKEYILGRHQFHIEDAVREFKRTAARLEDALDLLRGIKHQVGMGVGPGRTPKAP